ncbi:MAG: hypothetical protein ACYDER_10385 [Ktedonobacteraceae bacterium]
MVATAKRGVAAIALAMVLLASLVGWSLHVNVVMPQHHSSVSTTQLASGGPNFVCPPPPFLCD